MFAHRRGSFWVRAAQPDVEGGEPLLAVEDGGDATFPQRPRGRAVSVVALVVVPHDVVEHELARVGRLNLPHQERPDWVAAHQTVEEPRDLVARPDELALNRGQYVLAVADLAQRFGDGDGRLKDT